MAGGKPRRDEATTLISVGGRRVGVRIREIVLEVVSGPDQGLSGVLGKRQLSVGSNPANDLVLSDPAASRFHFRIRADERGYRLVDSGST